jgi:maltooligosyltrehalose trehalohydrolase
VYFGFVLTDPCSHPSNKRNRLSMRMRPATTTTTYGARLLDGTAEFRVWAPAAKHVLLQFENGDAFPMARAGDGTFSAITRSRPGDRYYYKVDQNRPVPDPVSRLLPEGVHGPTEIVDPEAFRWSDQSWRGLPWRDYLIYEMHVGAFTPEGTFGGVIERLDYLRKLGVTALELMPVAAFPGTHNWGYDGVSPYAVQASYGGPEGFKRLVNAAHLAGLAVVLDVVYNHLGNEGNYLRLFGPYFTDRHCTPWGDAINYDSPGCAGVRRHFVENALYWIHEYHLDGLRLDAIQTIKDESRYHIVEEIRDHVQALAGDLGRQVTVVAETDENDARLIRPKQLGGFGLDAVWSDDFHHAVHTALTRENSGYYQDFGKREQIARALNEGFAFQGEYFRYWGAPRGNKPVGVPLPAHVICIQNHDQVGNRAKGERLHHLVPPGAHKLAAALLLLAPETPLLFMGEECDETAPFQFFTDYGDPVLQKAVSEGRRNEFRQFRWEEIPDPQDPETYERSKLHREMVDAGNSTLRWYRRLIALRKQYVTATDRTCRAEFRDGSLILQVPQEGPRIIVAASFPGSKTSVQFSGWNEILTNDEDGYAVRIFIRPMHKE